MANKINKKFNEALLNKGQLRKLRALRKSVGPEIANKAFGEWIAKEEKESDSLPIDSNARVISEALEPLTKQGKLRIPRGGYVVRRGRGRVIVERARSSIL